MKILKNSKGIALFVAILVMTIIMLFLGASLFLSRVDTKITSNLKLATQALEVADAGLQHGLTLLQIGTDFDGDLNCPTPPCSLLSATPFPAGSDFTYSVTVENDSPDINNSGSPTDDTDRLVVLVSTANGPNGAKRQVQAYVNRSLVSFTPPSALYINASSITHWDDDFFDNDSLQRIIGNDTNPVDLLNGSDDTAGPNADLLGIATTSSGVKDDLITSAQKLVNAPYNDILGVGAEPSIGTTSDNIDVGQLANNFINDPGAVKYLDGLVTSSNSATCLPPCQLCTSSSPCLFGTVSTPQITYIKDNATSSTWLTGHVRGYGVFVVEGRTRIGGQFRFKGLVIHKKSNSSHYISIEDQAWVYGGVLFGSTDGNVTLEIEDYARFFYSSDALAMVESNWGSLFPRPARISVWLDKF